MIITERDFTSSELHIESICDCMKFRKISFVIKLWCIFHAMYSSMKNADKMLHLFNCFRLWMTCRDKSIKAQSYFWSANEQALAWLERVKKRRKLSLSVRSQAALSSRKTSWSDVQLISHHFHSLRSFSSRSAMTLWAIFLLYLACLSSLLIMLWLMTMSNSSYRNQIMSFWLTMSRWLRKSRSFWAWYSLRIFDLSIVSSADITSLKWRCFLRIRLICCLITWVTLCMNVVLSSWARWNWISSLRFWVRAWGMVGRIQNCSRMRLRFV